MNPSTLEVYKGYSKRSIKKDAWKVQLSSNSNKEAKAQAQAQAPKEFIHSNKVMRNKKL